MEEAKTILDPETQPAEVARATMIEARFHHYHGQAAKAAKLLLQAKEPAERSGDVTLLGWIYGYLSGAYQHLIDYQESNGWARRIIELTSGHPYYLQLLCSRLFDRCAPEGWVSQHDADLVLEEPRDLVFAEPGDRVVLLSDNRPEWHMVDLAAIDLGAADVLQAHDGRALALGAELPSGHAPQFAVNQRVEALGRLGVVAGGAQQPGDVVGGAHTLTR